MKIWGLALCLAALAGMSHAQQTVGKGTGVVLRGLDKVDGDVQDVSLQNGQSSVFGRLNVELRECRYPDGAAADAFAYLTIREIDTQTVVFEGWMVASSPALNALEHPRYDVWVLRCNTS